MEENIVVDLHKRELSHGGKSERLGKELASKTARTGRVFNIGASL
jgi:hypothetical protein